MFSFSSNLCFMCLKTYKNLTSVLIRDNEDIQKKLKYCLPEIVDSHLEIPKYICNNCISKLDCFYQFKQWCLQNNTQLNNYLQTLTSVGEKFKHLSVKLTDIKYQNKQQEVSTNQTLPIIGSHDELETKRKEDNGIYIKQEESIFTVEIKYADVLHVEKLDSIFDKEDIVVKEKDNVNIEFVKNTTCNYETLPIVGSGEKEDITTYIKEETGIERDDLLDNEEKDMIVKEECVTSEDIGDIEFYNEYVKSTKCESISSDSIVSFSDTEDLDETTIKKTAKKSFQCAICNKVFSYKTSLKHHLKLHTGIKEHECLICNKKFALKYKLTVHEKIHTGIKSFECTICKKMFLRKSELTQHEKLHTDVRKFECSICNKKFKRKSYLTVHEITHKGIKNFECNICDKKFMLRQNLAHHVKIHTGIKNYECLTCKKTFVHKGSLDKHQNKHSGVKNYQCSTCKKKFLYQTSLIRHKLIHTGTKKFECPICNKMFLQNCTLTRHKQNVHCLNEAESQ